MKLITHKEIADMVGMNPAHVRDRLTKRPDFPRAFLIGGARRWDEEQVQDWLRTCQQAPDGRRRKTREAAESIKAGGQVLS